MSALREALGEDIFEIFSEEVTEISENLERFTRNGTRREPIAKLWWKFAVLFTP